MAYGRLDVFWPDGKFESYLLENPTTTVGRSGGCTIVLETDTISRYHFSMTADQNGNLEIADMDSANGTFLDGGRLGANESRPLRGGEEIQIGHLRIIYHPEDDYATSPMAVMDEDTQRFVREDLDFRIDVYGPDIAVPPGAHTSVEVSIYNGATDERRFTVKVSGLPNGWARINRPELIVEPDENAPVLINIKPYIRSDSKPGDYKMQITVALKDDPKSLIEAEVTVTILPYIGFGMALASTEVSAYEAFKLHLHNQGTIGLPVTLMGRSPDNALRFVIRQPQLILAPGQRMVAKGEILPVKRRFLGSARVHPFDLMVRSRDDASFLAAVRGHYEDAPILPRWAGFALLTVLIGVLSLVAIAMLLLTQATPRPQIEAARANPVSVVRGDPFAVEWEVLNAETVTILVNNTPVAENIPAGEGQTQIDTSEFSGQLSVVVRAINNDKSAESILTVVLEEPLVIEFFEVSPTVMARNVVQTLAGRWRVAGATETGVQGLQALGPVTAEVSFGPEGSFEVSGLPVEAFSVILYAEDDRGNAITRSVEITLFDPVCTTTVENLNLFSAPDLNANVISTLALGQAIIINARSQDGLWLRTSREGIQAWGRAENLRCEESFDPANLYVDPATLSLQTEQTPMVDPVDVSPTPQP